MEKETATVVQSEKLKLRAKRSSQKHNLIFFLALNFNSFLNNYSTEILSEKAESWKVFELP